MPHDIRLEGLFAGIATHDARDGQMVNMLTQGLTTSEDGYELVSRLEGIVTPLLEKAVPQKRVSQVELVVAILRRDLTATVYVDELGMVGKFMAKGTVTAGRPVLLDQIADIGPITFRLGPTGDDPSLEIPDDAGVIVVLSFGWRKALLFDLSPLHGAPREFDFAAQLGNAWGYLLYQERLRATDAQWDALLAADWFPFVGLSMAHATGLFSHLKAGWDPDELLPAIADELKARCDNILASAAKTRAFEPHLDVLRATVRHYTSGDHLSAAGLIYPRIEGIMRSHAELNAPGGSKKQNPLITAAVNDPSGRRLAQSLLVPHRFERYLREVCFAPFTAEAAPAPGSPEPAIDAGRHPIAHGVASSEKMNFKAATLGLLVVEQLLYLCRS